jgi:hypothetical protein
LRRGIRGRRQETRYDIELDILFQVGSERMREGSKQLIQEILFLLCRENEICHTDKKRSGKLHFKM